MYVPGTNLLSQKIDFQFKMQHRGRCSNIYAEYIHVRTYIRTYTCMHASIRGFNTIMYVLACIEHSVCFFNIHLRSYVHNHVCMYVCMYVCRLLRMIDESHGSHVTSHADHMTRLTQQLYRNCSGGSALLGLLHLQGRTASSSTNNHQPSRRDESTQVCYVCMYGRLTITKLIMM